MNRWFYAFYSIGDVIKYTIGLVILHVLLIPYLMLGISGLQVGSITFIFAYVFIASVNTGYYLFALIKYIVLKSTHRLYKPKKSLTLVEKFMIPKDYF